MLAWALLAIWPCAADAASELPYKAIVRTSRTEVRSGPGREHFVTQELSAGAEVEVHRVDPGGWLAIRPPEGSLSWVSAKNASEVDEGLATVEGPGVVSLVGSQFSDQRGSFQVVLEPGESLEVLDEVLFEDKAGASTWLMISPPAGEFRWIAAADVRRADAPEGEVATVATSEAPKSTSPRPATAEPVAFQEEASEPKLAPPGQRQWTSAKRPLAPVSQASAEDLSKTIRDELDALEMELSAMVADEPIAWHVEPLRARVDNLLLLPHTSADARRALSLSRRLDRFAALSRRAQAVPPTPQPRTPSGWTPPPSVAAVPVNVAQPPAAYPPRWIAPQPGQFVSAPPPVGALLGRPAAMPGFDASGLLRPVILPGQAAGPAYAIVDAQGRPLSYVAATPNLDLRPYVGHAVGVNGPRGFDLQRGAPLVRADRVTLLDGPARR